MESIMYNFSGPPQVSRKSIPAVSVTSAKEIPGVDALWFEDGLAAAGLWEGDARWEKDSLDSQTRMAATPANSSIHVKSLPFAIIGSARPPSHRSQAALCLK